MKWLATFLCLLAMPALADLNHKTQSQPPPVTFIPLATPCGSIPLDETYLEKFGEIGMLEGEASIYLDPTRALNGTMRMYVNPETKTFTVVFSIGEEMYCMIVSGKELRPFVKGIKS